MAKKTQKEIEQTLRNKLARQYTGEIERLKERISELWDTYCRARKECDKYQQENEELKDKVEQYEDWVRRLHEFVGMSESEFKTYIENEKTKADATKKISDFLNNPIFNLFGY